MRIVIVFHDNLIRSGATMSMLSLVEKWVDNDISVIAIVPKNGELQDILERLKIKVYNAPHFKQRINLRRGKGYKTLAKIWGLFSFLHMKLYVEFYLSRKIKSEDVDIIYSNTSATILGYCLMKSLRLPHVWHIREFGREDQNCTYVLGEMNLFRMINESALIIVISNAIYEYYNKYITNVEFLLAYDDLSPDYDIYFDRNWDDEKIVILSAGSLAPGKGHMDAINSTIMLKENGYNIELLIAGKITKYGETLIKFVSENNAGNYIEFLGLVEDMNSLRKKCNVGIVASVKEPFGRVTVEGMLSGMLMIGANSAGTAELIENGQTGLLYNQGNVVSLVEKIVYIYNNRDSAKKMANNGYVFSKRFTKGNCANSIKEKLLAIRTIKRS